jgi:hypothetical protein
MTALLFSELQTQDTGQRWSGYGPLGLDERESSPSLEADQFEPYQAYELAEAGAVCEHGRDDD